MTDGSTSGAHLIRSGKFALYRQIAERLRGRIAEGTERLPSERELARAFGVARVTVRAALYLLADEHLIERRRRHGTRACAPKGGGSPMDAEDVRRTCS